MPRSFIAALLAVATLCACASASDPQRLLDPASALVANPGEAVVLDPAADSLLPRDPVTIDSARVVGDTLVVNVSHGGGCAEHAYRLVVSTIWMESFPVQAPARISHDANDDRCKALLRRELRIGLSPVAAAYQQAYHLKSGTVSLRLAGSDALLWYQFQPDRN